MPEDSDASRGRGNDGRRGPRKRSSRKKKAKPKVRAAERRRRIAWWRAMLEEIFRTPAYEERLLARARGCVERFGWNGAGLGEDAEDLVAHAVEIALQGDLKTGMLKKTGPNARPPVEQAIGLLCKAIWNRAWYLANRRRRRHRALRQGPARVSTNPAKQSDAILDLQAGSQHMSSVCQDALVDMGFDGLTTAEYAAKKGISERAARDRFDRAKATLRAALPDYPADGRDSG